MHHVLEIHDDDDGGGDDADDDAAVTAVCGKDWLINQQ